MTLLERIGSHLFCKVFEQGHDICFGRTLRNAIRNVLSGPDQGFCRIMEHRPVAKDANRRRALEKLLSIHVAIIPLDPLIGGCDLRLRTFEKLKKDILATDKRAGDVVPFIASACIEKDSA